MGKLIEIVGDGDGTMVGFSSCLVVFLHGVLVGDFAFFYGFLLLLTFDKTILKRGPSPKDELKVVSSRLGCVFELDFGGNSKFGGCVVCLSFGHTS